MELYHFQAVMAHNNKDAVNAQKITMMSDDAQRVSCSQSLSVLLMPQI